MTLDLDHKKTDLLRPSHDLDDDEESPEKHAFPEATRNYFIMKGQQRAGQAARPDPKKAREASDGATIQGVRAALVEHAGFVKEASQVVGAAIDAKHDISARQTAVQQQFTEVKRAFDKIDRYCMGARLDPKTQWVEVGQSVAAVHRAYELFKAAMERAYTALSIDRSQVEIEHIRELVDRIHSTTGQQTTVHTVGQPPAEKHAALRVIAVHENLEATREASASILAGNSDDARRLTAHLRFLIKGELSAVKTSNPVEYKAMAKLVGEVVANLDTLAGRYPTADQEQTYIVAQFRSQL